MLERFRQRTTKDRVDLPPIRGEILGVERLETEARALAARHAVDERKRSGFPLLAQLDANARVLRSSYRALVDAAQRDEAISPAAEWLIDNFHIVEEQTRVVRDALPVAYYRELPKLLSGSWVGYPRTYALADAYVAHTDSRFDPETLEATARGYQREVPLTMGELWSLPIMLRIAMIENMRRIAERIVRSRVARTDANQLVARLMSEAERDPDELARLLKRYERRPIDGPFTVALVRQLRDSDPAASPVLTWLEERLASHDVSAEDIVRREHLDQLAAHATTVNLITSMRRIGAHDWSDFFERVSVVERILRRDPTRVYPQMDFATRDTYRHAIEELARGSDRDEASLAEEVLETANRAYLQIGPESDPDDPRRYLGYHLIRGGRRAFEKAIGYRPPLSQWLVRAYLRAATPGYLGTIALVSALLVALLLVYTSELGVSGAGLIILALLSIVPATDLAIAVVHRDVGELLSPRRLPKLDFESGVPEFCSTLIVVPTIVSSDADAREQVEQLERHYLVGGDGHFALALLSDWPDADTEIRDGDDSVVATLAQELHALNERYGPRPDGGHRFLLLHRRRRWNESEGRWMGWERKRGKISELNRYLRGDRNTSFIERGDGLTDAPDDVRYVLTLDADTRLPPGTVEHLVGAMAHPLNTARYDATTGRVEAGYGILQPRVTPVLPPAGEGSLYHRIFAGPTGIDPYSAAVSDVYQDVFNEASYVGKGIYDVDAFEAALANRVPENALLSHDLFEGSFARTGLVSDIEVFDDFPTHYETAMRRAHRWARGDWQLLPWLIGWVPTVNGERRPVRLPAINRWKMIDNLRRTLSAPSTFLLLVVGWVTVPVSPLLWTAFVIATIAMPQAVPVLTGLMPRRRGIAKRSHIRGIVGDAVFALARVGLAVVFMANRAALMGDAITRTLVRLVVTRRRLLEWVTAAQSRRGAAETVADFYRRLWPPVALAILALITVGIGRPEALTMALPVIALWIASPAIAAAISWPMDDTATESIDVEDAVRLRRFARRTWRFFEVVVTAEDRYLPPDNLQEDPETIVAHRTSPTNIGMYLMSTIAARDFGWIGDVEMRERLERTIEALSALDRFKGHFFNWYDTRTGVPLEPRYVSTVDSGNLAGHLLTVAGACRADLSRAEIEPARAVRGIVDALEIARRQAASVDTSSRAIPVSDRDLAAALDAIAELTAEVPDTVPDWIERLDQLAIAADELVDVAVVLADGGGDAAVQFSGWAAAVRDAVATHSRDVTALASSTADDAIPAAAGRSAHDERLRALAARADVIVDEMDFGFLYDRSRHLFPIGYRVAEGRLDTGYYDLLASESRLASLVAIAKDDVPVEHWFHLGRPVTPTGQGSALLSWSGSMFEYLMPYLVMKAAPRTLVERTQRLIVARQIRYGRERGVPWGVSESAYNARDLSLNYQYSHFGVPGLGLTRGLSEDVVVAPYASALAVMVDPGAATDNLMRLAEMGALGPYGFYEALDFTSDRLPKGESVVFVRAYMAHHQGMSLVAIDNALNDGIMRERFHSVPIISAAELLLQERVPRDVSVARPRPEEVKAARNVRYSVPSVVRRFQTPHTPHPQTHLLSNGRYTVMVTQAGSGYSRCSGVAVTRWREDTTRDSWGSFHYLRDVDTGSVWSVGYQPSAVEPEHYEAAFSEDRAEFHRRDGALWTSLEVIVSPEDDGELRRVTVKNLGSAVKDIEITSYAEIVLTDPPSDDAHPAFQKLFVQTEFLPLFEAIIATRRPRADDEERIWAAHVATVEGETVGSVQYETDRSRFLDRGRGVRRPSCVSDGRPLSNTTGAVLDPIFSLRRTVRLGPGETARVTFSTLIGDSREAVMGLVDKYREPTTFEREASLAWTQAQVQLQHLGIEPDEAHLFQRLAGYVVYLGPALRPPAKVLERNEQSQSALWQYGISGDLPIIVVRIEQMRDREIVRQLTRAHEYWAWKGLAVDLVVLNEHGVSYAEELQEWLERNLRMSQSRAWHETHSAHGDVQILRADQVPKEDLDLLRTAARVVLRSHDGSLAEQLVGITIGTAPVAGDGGQRRPAEAELAPPRSRLAFFNGLGGFADGGHEYVTILGEGQWTPAPWINVIANPHFGFIVSESGSGYTWSVNSRENRLTPWSNDPVSDPPGEVLYLRDEETGDVWTPTPLPMRQAAPYEIRHGQGWTRFEVQCHEIASELVQWVPMDDPIKISRLKLTNVLRRSRTISVTGYVEWVLGVDRTKTAAFVKTEIDIETRALFARNPWNSEFADRVAFADMRGQHDEWTGDRLEFLGRHGTLREPRALFDDAALSGRVGPGLDPCGALRREVKIPAGSSVEIIFVLGQEENEERARALIVKYRTADLDAGFMDVSRWWDDALGALQVRTPDYSMAIVLNRWLLYQALSCRVWARSAFYQSGGAFGFRDQLQDVMALVVARREITRDQLVRAAHRQFPEGDVQHWWHPPTGRGVRTRITDDRIWLPFAVAHYLAVTGDSTVLDEEIPFLEGEPLPEGELEKYFDPETSDQSASLYEHCARAIDVSLDLGPHGLPLIGSGDWNDGMNRVGHEGRGESVWLAWFLDITIHDMLPIAEARGDAERVERWRSWIAELEPAIARDGWDGNWYRRAYFDDGTPLGSASNEECKIDSIAQSWAVLSNAARQDRAEQAMKAVEQHLVKRGDGLVLLFTPPFDKAPIDPGYIKGYVPGVRENGGQYTHAAIWSMLAFAELGDGDNATELFSILNPINHGSTRAGIHRYKVEPYVAVADVYAQSPHVGRGGWTWYTGSAGWMYRAGMEWILGFRLRGEVLYMDPCIPRDWPDFEIEFRYHASRYRIEVENPSGVMCGVRSAELDDESLELDTDTKRARRPGARARIDLVDDGAEHVVRIVLG